MSLLSFRTNVAEALLESSPPPPPPVKRGRPSLNLINKENIPPVIHRMTPNPPPRINTPFDNYDHWPIHAEKRSLAKSRLHWIHARVMFQMQSTTLYE